MLRRLLPLLLLFACSFWTAALAADEPVAASGAHGDALDIIFSANSGGEYEPCPVCGGKAMGGLARRATAFAKVRARIADGPALFLAGPYEFLPYRGLENPTPDLARALAKAYRALDFDAVYCVGDEADWMKDSGAEAPESLVTATTSIQLREYETHGVRVGVIYLPKLLKGADRASETLMDSVARKAKSLAERTDVVVGVSPWGAAGEAAFLSYAPGVVDVLLGGGPGPGLAGRFMAGGKTFWARAYTMGKAFHVIRLGELPRRDDPEFRWIRDENIALDFTVLDKNVPDEPTMAAMLDEFQLPTVK